MHLRHILSLVGLLIKTTHSHPARTFQDECNAFAEKIRLKYTFTVNIAGYLPPNTMIDYKAEGLDETCKDALAHPIPIGVCRLNLRYNTTKNSEVYMEVWLPESWEGRVLMTGNGALSGCIRYLDVAYGASYGFATFGTNVGHNGSSGEVFYRHPDVLEDFVWRGIYTGTIVGKSITKQFYGHSHNKSYYIGCSTGGRQGWKAVQRNPELFDGVITGSPAIDWFSHIAWFGYALKTLGFNANDTVITLEQWTAVQAEALRQCDSIDGANDDIIEDPEACKLDWTPLMCSYVNSTTCLTSAQTENAAKLFVPVTYNGTVLTPGHLHGYEIALISALYTPFVMNLIEDVYRYITYQDPSWKFDQFTSRDAFNALQLDLIDLNSFNGDISAFRNHGGKILHWHGTTDNLVSIGVSDSYYKQVQTVLKASVTELDSFYRYFHASGVAHCYTGPGANYMGQLGGQDTGRDPDDNMLVRIVEWVEKGHAPEFVRGTKFVDDTVSLGVEFKRKHCKYPQVNRYKINGSDWTDEESWECVSL